MHEALLAAALVFAIAAAIVGVELLGVLCKKEPAMPPPIITSPLEAETLTGLRKELELESAAPLEPVFFTREGGFVHGHPNPRPAQPERAAEVNGPAPEERRE